MTGKMSCTGISSAEELERLKSAHRALVVYFRGNNCPVCSALLPGLNRVLQQKFPLISLALVDTEKCPELAARLSIFSVPAVLVYLDGKLFFREVRHISLEGLAAQLDRPYKMLFS